MVQPNPGAQSVTLNGSEIVDILGLEWLQTTTGAIAALAAFESSPIINTAITTVGDGVLTAAGLIGGLVVRSGPVAAFTDTTATAAAIIAALPSGTPVGSTFLIRIKNATQYVETLAAGVGVTLPSSTIVGPFQTAYYFGKVVTSSTVSLTHLSTDGIGTATSIVSPQATALATVGAGTITAAGIAAGITTRSGSQSSTPFTDTTDTATAIVAAQLATQGRVGASFQYVYVNNTNAVATLTGGVGVTVSGVTALPPNSWAKFLVTYTAATPTVTIVGIQQGFFPVAGTFTNNGTSTVTTSNAAITASSQVLITLKTVGGTVGAIPHLLTITPGTGFATVGTASDTSVYNYTILG